MLRKQSPTAAIEAELGTLRARRAALETSLAEARAAGNTAATAVQAALLAGEITSPAMTKAETAGRAAGDRALAIEQAIGTIGQKIADAEALLASEQDRLRREEFADVLNRSAGLADAAGADLHNAIAALAKAFGRVVNAIPDHMPPVTARDDNRELKPEAIAAMILAEGLAASVPGLFPILRAGAGHPISALRRGRIAGGVVDWSAEFAEPCDASAMLERVVSGRMRYLADAILTGEAPAVLPTRAPEPVPHFRPRIGEVAVFVTQPAKYLASAGAPVMVTTGERRLPAPVAKAAIARGVAIDMATPEGEQRAASARAQAAGRVGTLRSVPGSIGWDACTDLQVDLEACQTADVERQRTEWLAARGRAA